MKNHTLSDCYCVIGLIRALDPCIFKADYFFLAIGFIVYNGSSVAEDHATAGIRHDLNEMTLQSQSVLCFPSRGPVSTVRRLFFAVRDVTRHIWDRCVRCLLPDVGLQQP